MVMTRGIVIGRKIRPMGEEMVARTFQLTEAMDRELRQLATRLGSNSTELVRKYIAAGFASEKPAFRLPPNNEETE
jgi:hypothetical protein